MKNLNMPLIRRFPIQIQGDFASELRKFLRFCITGTLAFCVDAGILLPLYWLGLSPSIARCFSFLGSVFFGWQLNRRWSFGITTRPTWSEFLKYTSAQSLGLIVNFITYQGALSLLPHTSFMILLALATASLAGLAFNYLGTRHWIYRGK